MNTSDADLGGWGRSRLLAILGAACAAVLVVVVGLVLAVRQVMSTSDVDAAQSQAAATIQAVIPQAPGPHRRAAIAGAPMLTVAPTAARAGTPATTPAPVIAVPAPTTTGPAGVPSGLPHTPQGAVAQLAGIDTTVLVGMSISQAHQVHQAWSAPGAVPAGQWVMTTNVAAFLAAAGQPGQTKQAHVAVTAVPVAGQVKGTDGHDWVLACVLLEVTAVITEEARIAYGHCEPMTWQNNRWVIGPGPAPAAAPSTWPGTDLAAAAGWATWATTSTE